MRAPHATKAFDPRRVLLARWDCASWDRASAARREMVDRVLDAVGAADDRGAGEVRLRALLVAGMESTGLAHLAFNDEAPQPLRELSEIETVLRACEDLCAMLEAGRKAEAADALTQTATAEDDGQVLAQLSAALEGMESMMAHATAMAELRGALVARRQQVLGGAATGI
jgi:hypothetical protein